MVLDGQEKRLEILDLYKVSEGFGHIGSNLHKPGIYGRVSARLAITPAVHVHLVALIEIIILTVNDTMIRLSSEITEK